MFWNSIPRSILFITNLDVLPSLAFLRTSSVFMSVWGLLCPHCLWAANRSHGFKEPQPSVKFMSSSLREGSGTVGNERTRRSRVGEPWAPGLNQDTWLLGPWALMTTCTVSLGLGFLISTGGCTSWAVSLDHLNYVVFHIILGLPPFTLPRK